MLDTAPYNLGWQTHFLNLVYSPRKAVSAVIAAEATRELPRYSHYGDYPDNRRFGPFRVSYEEDTSEMVTDEKFLYANDTKTKPPKPAALKLIVGLGSSPIVDYEGCGIYFLDKLAEGGWRLEVYPDAVLAQDPFAKRLNYKTVCSRLVSREWPMTIRLPDLGDAFSVTGLNAGNTLTATAHSGTFEIKPGVYLLSKNKPPARDKLPARVGRIGLTEFVCPPPPDLPVQLLPVSRAEYLADQPLTFAADVVDNKIPQSATLLARAAGTTDFQSFAMSRKRGYRCEATIPAGTFTSAEIEYHFAVVTGVDTVRLPAEAEKQFTARLAKPNEPLALFDAETDLDRLVFTRIGDGVRHGIFQRRKATDTEPAALRLFFPLSYDRTLDDYTASLAIKNKIADRGHSVSAAKALLVKARGEGNGQQIYLTLVEADGTRLEPAADAVNQLAGTRHSRRRAQACARREAAAGLSRAMELLADTRKGPGSPQDRPRLEAVEHLQLSFRPGRGAQKSDGDTWADITSVTLRYD